MNKGRERPKMGRNCYVLGTIDSPIFSPTLKSAQYAVAIAPYGGGDFCRAQ